MPKTANERRAERGKLLYNRYARLRRFNLEDRLEVYSLSDAIADLLHFGRLNKGFIPEHVVRRAVEHHNVERGDMIP